MLKNIFSLLPEDLTEEQFELIEGSDKVKIERIISKGHTSPDQGWYEQEKNEWVLLLKGAAILTFTDPVREVRLVAGDYLTIPAGCLHQVSWTDPEQVSLWLAVFY